MLEVDVVLVVGDWVYELLCDLYVGLVFLVWIWVFVFGVMGNYDV